MSVALVLVLFGAMAQTPADGSCLERVAKALELARADIGAMVPAAEQAAKLLADGGKLYSAGQPSLVSEITGRAGGLMMIKPLAAAAPTPGDVVLYTPEPGVETPEALRDTKAMVVMLGAPTAGQDGPVFANHATETGISPSLANAIPAWMFMGELVAALTRLGRMPVIYESIGAYGGYPRMAKYKSGEIAFHDDCTVPPCAPGVIANAYAGTVAAMLRRVEKEERARLDKAGAWVREARKGQKQLFMYSMGHLFPDEVGKTDIGRLFQSAGWNAGFRAAHPEDSYHDGDLAVHICYQHPTDALLRKARPAGARVVYVSLFADRDFVRDDGVIWIDPMWNWPDACVPLEGYDVPLLAASGVVNGAIAWEIYRLGME
jgi:hypothetical protein